MLRRSAVITASLLTFGGLVSFAVAAGAAPQPTVGQVQAKVNKLTSQEDEAVQAYDQSAQELVTAKQRLALVNHEVRTDRAKFEQMRTEIAQIATTAYESGNMSSIGALLTSNNPRAIMSQASILLQLSSDRSAQVGQFVTAARELNGAQQMALRTTNAITALNKQRLARKKSIAKSVAKQQAILATLTAQQEAAVSSLGGGSLSGNTSGTCTRLSYTGPTSTAADKAVEYVYSKLCDEYVFGATGPDTFDCSGLVQAAWASAGVSIPRDTFEQVAAGFPTVARANLEPGDLIFFDGDGHVAMYVGGGDIIDAPTTGEVVEKLSLSESWYSENYDSAMRP